MMGQSEKDAGTIAALMLRFTKFRLPRAKRLLKKVNNGETLDAGDIAFLKRVREDNQSNIQLVKRNPTYQGLVTGFMELYIQKSSPRAWKTRKHRKPVSLYGLKHLNLVE